MKISSPAFAHNGTIPKKYTCDGEDVNPELQIHGVPENAKSLALVVDDPDATGGGTFTHWVVYNIDSKTALIKEASSPGAEGETDFGKRGYGGPCPPAGSKSKPHRYVFTLSALDIGAQEFYKPPTKGELIHAMEGHVIAEAALIGLYGR